MIESEYKRLIENTSECISIGITEKGEPCHTIGVPWSKTSNAYNMRTPNIYIDKDDIEKSEVMNQIRKHKVIGCYIFVTLKDYSFLENFPFLRDLHIKNAYTIEDLSFMKKIKNCRMFFLHGAHLKNINEIVETKKQVGIRYVMCLGLSDCTIEDISSVLENEKQYYSEFSIWTSHTDYEMNRWKGYKADSKCFYIFEYIPKIKINQ